MRHADSATLTPSHEYLEQAAAEFGSVGHDDGRVAVLTARCWAAIAVGDLDGGRRLRRSGVPWGIPRRPFDAGVGADRPRRRSPPSVRFRSRHRAVRRPRPPAQRERRRRFAAMLRRRRRFDARRARRRRHVPHAGPRVRSLAEHHGDLSASDRRAAAFGADRTGNSAGPQGPFSGSTDADDVIATSTEDPQREPIERTTPRPGRIAGPVAPRGGRRTRQTPDHQRGGRGLVPRRAGQRGAGRRSRPGVATGTAGRPDVRRRGVRPARAHRRSTPREPARPSTSWERHHCEIVTEAHRDVGRASGILREHLADVGCDPLAVHIVCEALRTAGHNRDRVTDARRSAAASTIDCHPLTAIMTGSDRGTVEIFSHRLSIRG